MKKNKNRKCKECVHFNDFEHTYIENDGKTDCCSRWHIAYHLWEDKANRPCCECFNPIRKVVQLSLF